MDHGLKWLDTYGKNRGSVGNIEDLLEKKKKNGWKSQNTIAKSQ